MATGCSVAAERNREIAARREAMIAAWPAGWARMMQEWRADGSDAVWLTYAANYLLRTGGTRWMIDPARLNNLVPDADPVPLDDLAALDFVLLTHAHSDHVDAGLQRELAGMKHLRWVVPRHMLPVVERHGVSAARTVVPEPLRPVTIGEVTIRIFDGLHWEYPGRWGVGRPVAGIEATGCLVEWADRRALFPGDTRTYDVHALPAFGAVDTLFAHVWLGRAAALQPEPPLLEAFCNFVAVLAPTDRVLLTHLWQVSRSAEDYWDHRHAEQVRGQLCAKLPGREILVPELWRQVVLS